jgi:hypothetical protein
MLESELAFTMQDPRPTDIFVKVLGFAADRFLLEVFQNGRVIQGDDALPLHQ